MDTFWTYHCLLEDLVAHRRDRISGIVWEWEAIMQAVMRSGFPSVMVNERKGPIFRCLVRVTYGNITLAQLNDTRFVMLKISECNSLWCFRSSIN